MEYICVFCGSSPHIRPTFIDVAKELGALIAKRNLTLIYGGANLGMMGAIADSVLSHGGRVVGVMHESLLTKNVVHKHISELRIVASIHERKALMKELSDIFIALPGGMGTLDELFYVVAEAQLGTHYKPCGILNTMQYFNHLQSFLDEAHRSNFLSPADRELIVFHDNPSSLLDILSDMHIATNVQTTLQSSKEKR